MPQNISKHPKMTPGRFPNHPRTILEKSIFWIFGLGKAIFFHLTTLRYQAKFWPNIHPGNKILGFWLRQTLHSHSGPQTWFVYRVRGPTKAHWPQNPRKMPILPFGAALATKATPDWKSNLAWKIMGLGPNSPCVPTEDPKYDLQSESEVRTSLG